MSSGEQRDRRKFVEDFVLADVACTGAGDVNMTRRVIEQAVNAWKCIEEQAPYER